MFRIELPPVVTAPDFWCKATQRRTRGASQPGLVRLSDSGLVLEDLTQDVRGLDVFDKDGDRIGTVEHLYADTQEGKVRFLEVVSAGGFVGLGDKRFLVPAEAVGEVREDGVVVVDQSRQKVAESPPFDADVVVPQPAYQREVHEYYGYPPGVVGPYPGGA